MIEEPLSPHGRRAIILALVTRHLLLLSGAWSLLFRFLPERLHLVYGRGVKGTTARLKPALDVAEAAAKFAIGQLQRGLRLGPQMARDIGDGEEQVAQLFAHARLLPLRFGPPFRALLHGGDVLAYVCAQLFS